MHGLYDNEEGHYVADPALEAAPWYEDLDGLLYIVPDDGEIDGPDNEIVDQINAICRAGRRLAPSDLDRLGLIEVAPVLKRFDPSIGYYHA